MPEFYPLDEKQSKLVNKVYYDDGYMVGRDRLYKYIREHYPEYAISRRAIQDFLSKQETNQRFRQKPKQTNTRPILSSKQGRMVQIDLIELPSYNKYQFCVNMIDLFSRYAWSFAIKNKKPETIEKLIVPILKEIGCKIVITDNGTEFNFKYPEGIKHINTTAYTPTQTSMIERFNGSMKSILKKLLYHRESKNWVSLIPTITETYNNTYHRILKETPANVFNNFSEDQKKELATKLKEDKNEEINPEELLKVGQKVRLLIVKSKTNKLQANYTKSIYEIVKVIKGNNGKSNRYQVKDNVGNVVKGYFNLSKLLIIKEIQEEVQNERRTYRSKMRQAELNDLHNL